MDWLRRHLLFGLLAWMAAFGVAQAAAPEANPSERQVLVLLRLPAEHLRPDAGYAGGYGNAASQAARRRIAGRIARDHGLKLVTGWPMPLVGLDCFVLAVPDGQSPVEVAANLSHDRDVAWSEPMHTYRAEAQAASKPGPPNDPLFRAQPAAKEWRLDALHRYATGRNVRVAVVDSDVDVRHPDLAGQILSRQNFVAGRPDTPEQHGTGVAGIIAAVEDNQIGIVGVAPGARLMALRACWQQEAQGTICDTLSLAKAVHFAIDHSAQVINLSLAGPPDLLLGRLIDAAVARGIVVVGAVDPNLARGGFPASHPGVVAVASGGTAPGVYVAPGHDVPTTQVGGRWALVSGSSYSAAHVSGLYALLRERSPRGGSPMALLVAHAGGGIDACASLLGAAAPCRGVQPVAYSAIPRP
jgi:subtilisin family serine protease